MSDTAPSSRARKLRAVLAGGLVLGVGAAITLAAWNDSEFATGSFEAGSFNLEGSTDGVEFTEHAATDAAAPLGFTVNPTNLAPGDAVTGAFAVRLDDATTYGADVLVNAVESTGDVSNLTYSLTTTDGFGCESPVGETLVAEGTALGEVGTESPGFALTAGAGTPEETVNLCFTVTAGADLKQGQTGAATWEFLAESQA